MPAYLIATVRHVRDRKGLEEYWSRVGPTFEGTSAKPMAVYTQFRKLEGVGPVEGLVLVEFPDMKTAQQWYDSAGYQMAKSYREPAADIELLLVEGGAVTDPKLRMPQIP